MQDGKFDEIVLCSCWCFWSTSPIFGLVLFCFLKSPNSTIYCSSGIFSKFLYLNTLLFISNDLLSLFKCKFICFRHFVEKKFWFRRKLQNLGFNLKQNKTYRFYNWARYIKKKNSFKSFFKRYLVILRSKLWRRTCI